jgi:hypothetical protein
MVLLFQYFKDCSIRYSQAMVHFLINSFFAIRLLLIMDE